MDFEGVSIAGIETAIVAPELRLVLDMGRCTRAAVQQPLVLLSHGHLDHMGAIAQHAARRALLHMSHGIYIVPKSIATHVEQFFNAAGQLDGQVIPRQVVALEPGEEWQIGPQRWLRPFETYHRVPSQGYTVWERRQRLREEFRDLPGPRLAALREQGVEIQVPYQSALLSFTGDTRVEVLERTPELQHTRSLVIEVTFLDELVSVESARSMGHIHLSELLDRAELLPRSELVLSHFSARYREGDVARIISARVPDELRSFMKLFGIAEH